MPSTADPIRQLPPPTDVHAHIGQLLRELRLARRLLRLSETARDHLLAEATRRGLPLTTADRLPTPESKGVPRG